LRRGLIYGNSSVGRALVSKTRCREFEPLFPCQKTKYMFKKLVKYCKGSYEELAHKTTWPTRNELTHKALIVLSASVIIAIVVFAMDKLFEFVMTSVYPH
jgi:preprotein translocase subunit SecE